MRIVVLIVPLVGLAFGGGTLAARSLGASTPKALQAAKPLEAPEERPRIRRLVEDGKLPAEPQGVPSSVSAALKAKALRLRRAQARASTAATAAPSQSSASSQSSTPSQSSAPAMTAPARPTAPAPTAARPAAPRASAPSSSSSKPSASKPSSTTDVIDF